jgi:hypothetical protein
MAASVQDSSADTHLVDQVDAAHPTIRTVWVDGGYRQHLAEHVGIDMHIAGTRRFTHFRSAGP